MTKAKKIIIIVFTVLIFVIFCCMAAYFVYGSTMININSEKSINKHLAADANNPINIIGTKEYEDYFAILYTDPSDPNQEDNYAHFKVLVKHNLYKNRYLIVAEQYGNMTDIDCYQLDGMKTDHAVCFIYYISCHNSTKCLVYEDDIMLQPIRKLDEFDIDPNEHIYVKEYDLLSIYHMVETSSDYWRDEYNNLNENWEQTDKEFLDNAFQEQAKLDAEK